MEKSLNVDRTERSLILRGWKLSFLRTVNRIRITSYWKSQVYLLYQQHPILLLSSSFMSKLSDKPTGK